MSTIDRIRYYDGEFLRAFDYSDEQAYHVAMRRRINRYLHVCGIVRGLTLSSDMQGGVTDVSILPGMAIDAYGREIYLFAPYTFGDDDVTNSRITQTGTYDVWLRYQKTPSTPPSSGYGNCNQANQYTRWEESFSVVLLPNPSSPFSPPGFADVDDDDPSQDKVGVLLGTVYVDPTSPTQTFSSPLFDSKRCVLHGLIAQSIQAPPSWEATQAVPPFSFLNNYSAPLSPGTLNFPLTPVPASLEIKPNIFADQNLIVGPDFPLTAPSGGATTINISPAPSKEPSGGNVKIAGDLFVQGNIYSPTVSGTTTQWNGIGAYVQQLVQQLVPDVLSDSEPVTFPATLSNPVVSSTTSAVMTTSRLSKISKLIPIAFVLSSSFDPSVPNVGDLVVLSIDAVTFKILNNTQCTVTANWTAGPTHLNKCAFTTFTISFVAVCFP